MLPIERLYSYLQLALSLSLYIIYMQHVTWKVYAYYDTLLEVIFGGKGPRWPCEIQG